MIDIIIRDCGNGEWLPLIVATTDMGGFLRELYRGERVRSYEAASLRAKTAWDEATTGNIIEFKEANGL